MLYLSVGRASLFMVIPDYCGNVYDSIGSLSMKGFLKS